MWRMFSDNTGSNDYILTWHPNRQFVVHTDHAIKLESTQLKSYEYEFDFRIVVGSNDLATKNSVTFQQ